MKRKKKLIAPVPVDKELLFQPYQFYDEALPRVPGYVQRESKDGRDRSLYTPSEWRLRRDLDEYVNVLKATSVTRSAEQESEEKARIKILESQK